MWSALARVNCAPDWRFFQQPFQRGLITTSVGANLWGDRPGFDHIWVSPSRTVNWAEMVTALANLGVARVALLGGGTLVAQWLVAELVNELQLTICPLLLGGATAPTLVDGEGWLAELAPRLQLISVRKIADEVFFALPYQAAPAPIRELIYARTVFSLSAAHFFTILMAESAKACYLVSWIRNIAEIPQSAWDALAVPLSTPLF